MEADFGEIRWTGTTLCFRASLGELQKDLWIELPRGVAKPDDDLIAVVFAALAGPDLDHIAMDLSVSQPIKKAIEAFCGCELSAEVREIGIRWDEGFTNHAVSFSGGFDSLAAYSLLPGSPALVSMDFGGWFRRETEFFSTFDSQVVRTNFRMEGFGRRSWLFMLSGIVLLKQHLNLGSFTTGSILESSPWHYIRNIERSFQTVNLLKALGFEQINTTVGITEVATTMLAMRHFPERIGESLRSLAAPGTGKSQRKHMLVSALQRAGKAAIPSLPGVPEVKEPPLKWGESLTDDMLTPYMLKFAGGASTDALMANIPPEIRKVASNFNLTFYERYHTGMYKDMPDGLSVHVHAILYEAGIHPFMERDWTEYREITGILSRYHDIHID